LWQFGYAAAKLKIESPAFTAENVRAFVGELREHERDQLVARLEAAGKRLEALRPRLLALAEDDSAGSPAWTAREVLAHLALISKVYGVLAYQVAAGKAADFDLLGLVKQRDTAGAQAARQPVEEHLQAIAADQARTLAFLRAVSVEDLERVGTTGIEGLSMRAVDIVRLPLVNHVETHLDQLEAALG
jgi:DinB family protein